MRGSVLKAEQWYKTGGRGLQASPPIPIFFLNSLLGREDEWKRGTLRRGTRWFWPDRNHNTDREWKYSSNQAFLLHLLETGTMVALHRVHPGVQEPTECLYTALGTEHSLVLQKLFSWHRKQNLCKRGMVFWPYGRGLVPEYQRLWMPGDESTAYGQHSEPVYGFPHCPLGLAMGHLWESLCLGEQQSARGKRDISMFLSCASTCPQTKTQLASLILALPALRSVPLKKFFL